MKKISIVFVLVILCCSLSMSQDYFTAKYAPYADDILSPEEYLGYPIGSHHTRYDQMVNYLTYLADNSPRALIQSYGKTYGERRLVLLTVGAPSLLAAKEKIRNQHLTEIMGEADGSGSDLPVILNLGYNVHGNEPSGGEASLLTAYVLVASEHEDIAKYREEALVFIDPTINPDGRDRHSHWVNMHKGSPLVNDPIDIEHNEGWPRGRTNHYWFDLNRDWWLGIHPESRGKLSWYHTWYPNVVTDFHEMGTNSTFFFEPMKANASKDPVMPKENYGLLNETFATYFVSTMDEIGSLYFTKEVFDGTYPGYGSSYPDLQGGLGLLFEQASSRGHVQKTPMGDLTFPFTIRNQFLQSMATVEAAVDNEEMLKDYQREFFRSAQVRGKADPVKAYVFGQEHDPARTQAFLDKLLLHGVKVYNLSDPVSVSGAEHLPGSSFVVPTDQLQYRMVQNAFETYNEYVDSVFYDASAWSLVNFYNLPYGELRKTIDYGEEITEVVQHTSPDLQESSYAYLINWNDYYAPAALHSLLEQKLVVASAFQPFSLEIAGVVQNFDRGTLMLPVQKQPVSSAQLHQILNTILKELPVRIQPISSGYSAKGVDLGSRYMRFLEQPNVLLLVGNSVSGYEAGEVWHLLDQRVGMPITKVRTDMFGRIDLKDYNTLVMVSGSYPQLDSSARARLSAWVAEGNSLVTIREASAWAIRNKLVNEKLQKPDEKEEGNEEKTSPLDRLPYDQASQLRGRHRVGGAIFKADLDLSHPLCFGYQDASIPVYRNSNVWLSPSKNAFSTVAKYSDDPHIDGFISTKSLEDYLKPSASLVVSRKGGGRVIMFADNPNFRGSWYGTNRLFLNAIFLGQHIDVPRGE